MKKSTLFTLIALLSLAFLAACGGGGDAPAADEGGGGQAIEVIMNDIYFGETNDNVASPPVWTVKTGGNVTLTAVNNGTLDHNWAIVKADATVPDTVDPAAAEELVSYDVGVVAGGDTYNSAFRAPVPGEYLVICTVAGHYPAMQGKLVVEE